MPNRTLSFLHVIAASLCLAPPVHAGFQPRSPLKWDAFSQISCAEEVARLDNYASELGRQPGTLAVVVVFGGRRSTRQGEVVARLFGIRDHLIKSKSIHSGRIVILDGGFRERLEIELWILPAESRGDATLLISSDVPSKEVRLKMPRVKKWEYKCDS